MATLPFSSIGIVGGGQLALMLSEAAAELGLAVHLQTPSAADPAARLAASLVEAPLDDVAGTRRLAAVCGAISFENEWIPLEALRPLADQGVRFVPSLASLEPLLAKRAQRELLDRLHLPSPRWCGLEAVLEPPPRSQPGDGPQSLPSASYWQAGRPYQPAETGEPPAPARPTLPPGFGFPVIAKASRGGYDGKGTLRIVDQTALEQLLERVDPADWILEEQVAFERELAIVACRDGEGSVVCFPLVETHQHGQVCDWVLLPAAVNHGVEALARNIAASLLTALDYEGVLAVELFFGPAGLQVNEIAPRTHNSGHLTIEACRCSQFAQQVRLVAGLPMGLPEPIVPGALMVNLLGGNHPLAAADEAQRLEALRALPGAHLHWYGKPAHAPGRKLGHLTLLLAAESHAARCVEREQLLDQVRRIWPLPAAPATTEQPLE
ncbi:MAG: 5-(carboxyamino)imidazole ribonucleotide synthase [Cyanobium sp.]